MATPTKQMIGMIERAARHQVQALALLREVKDPGRRLSDEQRYSRLCWALQRLWRAKQLLTDAQANPEIDDELRQLLESHLERLQQITDDVNKLLAAQQRDGDRPRDPAL